MSARILIVDDDPICREIVTTALAGKGRAIESVGCGNKAVETLDRHPPHLLILDCALPGRSGIEVLRHVRGNAKLADVPVFLISARQSPGYQAAMLAEGAQDYFTKPLDLPRIRTAVSAVVGIR